MGQISKVVQKAKEEYKFKVLTEDYYKVRSMKKKNNREEPKRIKNKKNSSSGHRNLSSTSSSRNLDASNASASFVSQDSSVCSFSPIMGAPLPMISQNHIVSPNVPLTCAFPNVITETQHYFLSHPIDHHPLHHGNSSTIINTTSPPSFIHPDGSVHYPQPSTCDSHHSNSTHTEKTSNLKSYCDNVT